MRNIYTAECDCFTLEPVISSSLVTRAVFLSNLSVFSEKKKIKTRSSISLAFFSPFHLYIYIVQHQLKDLLVPSQTSNEIASALIYQGRCCSVCGVLERKHSLLAFGCFLCNVKKTFDMRQSRKLK